MFDAPDDKFPHEVQSGSLWHDQFVSQLQRFLSQAGGASKQ